jgi:hypothetical protein
MNSIQRTCRFVLAALLAVHLVLPIVPCPADIYRWQDEQGHWHFSLSGPNGLLQLLRKNGYTVTSIR